MQRGPSGAGALAREGGGSPSLTPAQAIIDVITEFTKGYAEIG